MPPIFECNDIPQNRDEIPTPEIALQYSHLIQIALMIPQMNHQADIELLIGRDICSAYFVLDQKTEGNNVPFAQKLPLGWVIILIKFV